MWRWQRDGRPAPEILRVPRCATVGSTACLTIAREIRLIAVTMVLARRPLHHTPVGSLNVPHWLHSKTSSLRVPALSKRGCCSLRVTQQTGRW